VESLLDHLLPALLTLIAAALFAAMYWANARQH
jgi:hypothetical protein